MPLTLLPPAPAPSAARPKRRAPSKRPLLGPARERVWLAGLFAAGIVLRAVYLGQVQAQPFFGAHAGAGAELLKRASEIAAGRWRAAGPTFDGASFDAWIASAVLAFPGAGPAAVCALQLAAGLVAVWILSRLARRLFGPVAGVATAALGALYGPFAFLDADLPGSAWTVLGIALALHGLVRWDAAHQRDRRPLDAPFVAGLGLAVAALERPQLALLVLAALAWCAGRALWRGMIPAAAGLVMPLAALAALAGPAAIGIPASAGARLFIGNHQGASGVYEDPWLRGEPEFAGRPEFESASRRAAESFAGRSLDPNEISALWAQRADAFLRRSPGEALGLATRKALRLVNGYETPSPVSYAFVREGMWALAAMPFGFGALLPLAAIGLVWWWSDLRRRPAAFLLILATAAAGLAVLPFFVTDRDRAALVPPLLVAAGAGVAALIRMVADHGRRAGRRTSRALLAGTAALVLALMPVARPARAQEWASLGREWRARGNLVAAAHAYEEAVDAASPRDAAWLLEDLARVYDAQGDGDRAFGALRDAVRADPARVSAHRALGLRYVVRGQPVRALRELSEAVRLGGGDPATLTAIAGLLAASGDTTGAATMSARATALAARDARGARTAMPPTGSGARPAPGLP